MSDPLSEPIDPFPHHAPYWDCPTCKDQADIDKNGVCLNCTTFTEGCGCIPLVPIGSPTQATFVTSVLMVHAIESKIEALVQRANGPVQNLHSVSCASCGQLDTRSTPFEALEVWADHVRVELEKLNR